MRSLMGFTIRMICAVESVASYLEVVFACACVSTSSIVSIWLSLRNCDTLSLCRETLLAFHIIIRRLAIDYLDCLVASSCNTMFWVWTSVCMVLFINDIKSIILRCMVTIIASRVLCGCTWICWTCPTLPRRASAYEKNKNRSTARSSRQVLLSRARHTGSGQLFPQVHGASSQDSIVQLWRTRRAMCQGGVATK